MKAKEFLSKLQNLPDNQKKIILWAVVGILAVAMGIFWIRGAMNSLNKIGGSISQIKIPEMATPETESATDSTADWKTYTNEDYGFEIEYPVDWTYQKFNCNLTGIAFCPLVENNPSFCGQTCSADSPSSPIYFYIIPNISNESLILRDDSYKEVYQKMLSTFKFINK